MNPGIAIPEPLESELLKHLARSDGQEDLCFALWHPSRGRERFTALLAGIILPEKGDREVHGNASFHGQFLERAIMEAVRAGGGLAFLHSHPAYGWQGMSADDVRAEAGMAGAVSAATKLPLVGLTLGARNGAWSARLWERVAPRKYFRKEVDLVRVIGTALRPHFHPDLRPVPKHRDTQHRTVTAWGPEAQGNLSRLHAGVIGAGSVGSLVAESLARIGVERISLIDFDTLEAVNLDRTLNAYPEDVGHAKVVAIARATRRAATSANPEVRAFELSVCEDAGYSRALDCDVLFSCVDRPWPRSILNFIAYAHLIPVVDGGILVRRTKAGRMRGANWKAHVASPGRACLACLGQYEPGEVDMDRRGELDDPAYIAGLPPDSVHLMNQNVFGFSMGAASLEVLQFLALVIRPGGLVAPASQNYHFPSGEVDVQHASACKGGCIYPGLVGRGDAAGHPGTAVHGAAERARSSRLSGSDE